MVESPEGRAVMTGEGGILEKLRAFYKLYQWGMQVNKTLVREQKEVIEMVAPDRIIYHPKSTYPLIHRMLQGKRNIMASPVPYVVHTHEDHAHLGFGGASPKWWNRLSYKLGIMGTVKALKMALGSLDNHRTITSQNIIDRLINEPFLYLVSPSLYKGPSALNGIVKVMGFHEKETNETHALEPGVLSFISKHRKVLLLTFGSMINARPAYTTQVFLEVFTRLKIPAIVVTGFGGLVIPEDLKDHPQFYFSPQLPFAQLLPKIFAVIHHGGAGTTQSGLKHGCATMIIPHLIDQFMWNRMVAGKGLGPKGIAIKEISVKKLEPLVKDLWNHSAYKENAMAISKKMQEENLKEALYQFLTQSFD